MFETFLTRAHSEGTDWDKGLELMQKQVEVWFDDVMERVSGWYARKTKIVVVILALIITALYNVDTLAIADALEHDEALRGMVANAADQFIANEQQNRASLEPGATITQTATLTETVVAFNTLKQQIDELGLPVGWIRKEIAPAQSPNLAEILSTLTAPFVTSLSTTEEETLKKASQNGQMWPLDPGTGGKKFAGLLLTVLALSLGAPFWFDLLNKLVNLRSAGKPPAENGEQPAGATASNTNSR
jgi:hypothetical protein